MDFSTVLYKLVCILIICKLLFAVLTFLAVTVFGAEIMCTSNSIVVNKNEAIPPIDCLDDSSIHLPLRIQNMPRGLSFDGKTLSGKIIVPAYNHFVFVYNNETSCQINVNGTIYSI